MCIGLGLQEAKAIYALFYYLVGVSNGFDQVYL
jgi:hypothetical protein